MYIIIYLKCCLITLSFHLKNLKKGFAITEINDTHIHTFTILLFFHNISVLPKTIQNIQPQIATGKIVD